MGWAQPAAETVRGALILQLEALAQAAQLGNGLLQAMQFALHAHWACTLLVLELAQLFVRYALTARQHPQLARQCAHPALQGASRRLGRNVPTAVQASPPAQERLPVAIVQRGPSRPLVASARVVQRAKPP